MKFKKKAAVDKKELLYCWVAQVLNVLVPKKRGEGYLKVPYGHHHDSALTEIANDAGVDVTGLDGSLAFECSRSIFYGPAAGRIEFASKVIPSLEKHYGWTSREIEVSEFWEKNPLTAGVSI